MKCSEREQRLQELQSQDLAFAKRVRTTYASFRFAPFAMKNVYLILHYYLWNKARFLTRSGGFYHYSEITVSGDWADA